MSKYIPKKPSFIDKTIYMKNSIPSDFKEKLTDLVKSGNFGELQEVLQNYPVNSSFQDDNTTTPILEFIIESDFSEYQKEKIIEILLNKGVAVNTLNSFNLPPIYYAIKNKYLNITEMLINHKANLKMRLPKGYDFFTAALNPKIGECPPQLINPKDQFEVAKYYSQTLDLEREFRNIILESQPFNDIKIVEDTIKYLLNFFEKISDYQQFILDLNELRDLEPQQKLISFFNKDIIESKDILPNFNNKLNSALKKITTKFYDELKKRTINEDEFLLLKSQLIKDYKKEIDDYLKLSAIRNSLKSNPDFSVTSVSGNPYSNNVADPVPENPINVDSYFFHEEYFNDLYEKLINKDKYDINKTLLDFFNSCDKLVDSVKENNTELNENLKEKIKELLDIEQKLLPLFPIFKEGKEKQISRFYNLIEHKLQLRLLYNNDPNSTPPPQLLQDKNYDDFVEKFEDFKGGNFLNQTFNQKGGELMKNILKELDTEFDAINKETGPAPPAARGRGARAAAPRAPLLAGDDLYNRAIRGLSRIFTANKNKLNKNLRTSGIDNFIRDIGPLAPADPRLGFANYRRRMETIKTELAKLADKKKIKKLNEFGQKLEKLLNDPNLDEAELNAILYNDVNEYTELINENINNPINTILTNITWFPVAGANIPDPNYEQFGGKFELLEDYLVQIKYSWFLSRRKYFDFFFNSSIKDRTEKIDTYITEKFNQNNLIPIQNINEIINNNDNNIPKLVIDTVSKVRKNIYYSNAHAFMLCDLFKNSRIQQESINDFKIFTDLSQYFTRPDYFTNFNTVPTSLDINNLDQLEQIKNDIIANSDAFKQNIDDINDATQEIDDYITNDPNNNIAGARAIGGAIPVGLVGIPAQLAADGINARYTNINEQLFERHTIVEIAVNDLNAVGGRPLPIDPIHQSWARIKTLHEKSQNGDFFIDEMKNTSDNYNTNLNRLGEEIQEIIDVYNEEDDKGVFGGYSQLKEKFAEFFYIAYQNYMLETDFINCISNDSDDRRINNNLLINPALVALPAALPAGAPVNFGNIPNNQFNVANIYSSIFKIINLPTVFTKNQIFIFIAILRRLSYRIENYVRYTNIVADLYIKIGIIMNDALNTLVGPAPAAGVAVRNVESFATTLLNFQSNNRLISQNAADLQAISAAIIARIAAIEAANVNPGGGAVPPGPNNPFFTIINNITTNVCQNADREINRLIGLGAGNFSINDVNYQNGIQLIAFAITHGICFLQLQPLIQNLDNEIDNIINGVLAANPININNILLPSYDLLTTNEAMFEGAREILRVIQPVVAGGRIAAIRVAIPNIVQITRDKLIDDFSVQNRFDVDVDQTKAWSNIYNNAPYNTINNQINNNDRIIINIFDQVKDQYDNYKNNRVYNMTEIIKSIKTLLSTLSRQNELFTQFKQGIINQDNTINFDQPYEIIITTDNINLFYKQFSNLEFGYANDIRDEDNPRNIKDKIKELTEEYSKKYDEIKNLLFVSGSTIPRIYNANNLHYNKFIEELNNLIHFEKLFHKFYYNQDENKQLTFNNYFYFIKNPNINETDDIDAINDKISKIGNYSTNDLIYFDEDTKENNDEEQRNPAAGVAQPPILITAGHLDDVNAGNRNDFEQKDEDVVSENMILNTLTSYVKNEASKKVSYIINELLKGINGGIVLDQKIDDLYTYIQTNDTSNFTTLLDNIIRIEYNIPAGGNPTIIQNSTIISELSNICQAIVTATHNYYNGIVAGLNADQQNKFAQIVPIFNRINAENANVQAEFNRIQAAVAAIAAAAAAAVAAPPPAPNLDNLIRLLSTILTSTNNVIQYSTEIDYIFTNNIDNDEIKYISALNYIITTINNDMFDLIENEINITDTLDQIKNKIDIKIRYNLNEKLNDPIRPRVFASLLPLAAPIAIPPNLITNSLLYMGLLSFFANNTIDDIYIKMANFYNLIRTNVTDDRDIYKLEDDNNDLYRLITSSDNTKYNHIEVVGYIFNRNVYKKVTEDYFNEFKAIRKQFIQKNEKIKIKVVESVIFRTLNDAINNVFKEIVDLTLNNSIEKIVNKTILRDVTSIRNILSEDRILRLLNKRSEKTFLKRSITNVYIDENYASLPENKIDVLSCYTLNDKLIKLLKSKLHLDIKKYRDVLLKFANYQLLIDIKFKDVIDKNEYDNYVASHDIKYINDRDYLNENLRSTIENKQLTYLFESNITGTIINNVDLYIIDDTNIDQYTKPDGTNANLTSNDIYDDFITDKQEKVIDYLGYKIKTNLKNVFDNILKPKIQEFFKFFVDNVQSTIVNPSDDEINLLINNIIYNVLQIDYRKGLPSSSLEKILKDLNDLFLRQVEEKNQINLVTLYESRLKPKILEILQLMTYYYFNVHKNYIKYQINKEKYIRLRRNLRYP